VSAQALYLWTRRRGQGRSGGRRVPGQAGSQRRVQPI